MTVTEYEPEIEQAEREQNLRDAKQLVAGATPLMEAPPDSRVVLARGLYVDGVWETDVYVRELTGKDEENLARFKEASVFLDAVIVYGVDRIGSIVLSDKDFDNRQGLLRELLTGEREQLFMAICRVTFGDIKQLKYTCGTCDEESEVDISITNNVKIPTMENPQQTLFNYTNSRGENIEYQLMTGQVQYEVHMRKGLSTAEQNTVLLSKLITHVDNQIVVDPLVYARSLSMRDRSKLVQNLIDAQPTPDTDLKIECSNCEATIDLRLTWELLFRP